MALEMEDLWQRWAFAMFIYEMVMEGLWLMFHVLINVAQINNNNRLKHYPPPPPPPLPNSQGVRIELLLKRLF